MVPREASLCGSPAKAGHSSVGVVEDKARTSLGQGHALSSASHTAVFQTEVYQRRGCPSPILGASSVRLGRGEGSEEALQKLRVLLIFVLPCFKALRDLIFLKNKNYSVSFSL